MSKKDMLGMSPGDDHLGLMIDFARKLQSGAITPMAAKRFLRGEVSRAIFPVWRTVKLGTGPKTPDDFRRAIEDDGTIISDLGDCILGRPTFTVSPEETKVDLVVVSVSELGFIKDGGVVREIYGRAKELGLQLAPAEVGPQLRLQYSDQPRGEWLVIGMEPITGSDANGHPLMFCVGRDGDSGSRWLIGSHGRGIYNFWFGGFDRFVFVLRK